MQSMKAVTRADLISMIDKAFPESKDNIHFDIGTLTTIENKNGVMQSLIFNNVIGSYPIVKNRK